MVSKSTDTAAHAGYLLYRLVKFSTARGAVLNSRRFCDAGLSDSEDEMALPRASFVVRAPSAFSEDDSSESENDSALKPQVHFSQPSRRNIESAGHVPSHMKHSLAALA